MAFPKNVYHFLEFHLQILQSLYRNQEELQEEEEDDALPLDKIIDAKTWELIDLFLNQRNELLQVKQDQERLKGIHNQALKYIQEYEAEPSDSTNLDIHIISSPIKLSSQQQGMLTPTSPSMPSPAPSTGPNGGSQQQQQDEDLNTGTIENFSVIAGLLGQRQKKATQTTSQKLKPFDPLLQDVLQRTEQLEKKWKTLKQQVIEQHYQAPLADMLLANDPLVRKSNANKKARKLTAQVHDLENDKRTKQEEQQRSKLSGLETKIRLWKLLISDLQQVIVARTNGPNSADSKSPSSSSSPPKSSAVVADDGARILF